ncbi:MAG TPA: biotin/lipoyl-binding protein [Burkholderiaceae bacterium]|jgi:HlyD family secretion protein
MRNKIIFALSACGIIIGLISAYILGAQRPAQKPLFQPVSSPYATAIYSNGMIESEQGSGENINIVPEVSGTVTKLLVHEGQSVAAGTILLTLDNAIQKASTEQLRLQAEGAKSLLLELKAQPRKENLEIAKAQVALATANVTTARHQYDKRLASYNIEPKSISKDVLDTAKDAASQADTALQLAVKQYELTKAGAWSFDVANQKTLADAAAQAYQAANAMLQKYTLVAPRDGVILAINASAGGFLSPQGTYDTYTQSSVPAIVMSTSQEYLGVRCYVDEILVSRLPDPAHILAEMSIRGTDIKVPLEFVRVQPYVSPKIELSNQRQERVDLRVLPVIFRFPKKDLGRVYPGLQVDVYIGQK